MVRGLGLEPRTRDSKSLELPITPSPNVLAVIGHHPVLILLALSGTNYVEPLVGVEPTAFRLQGGCTAKCASAA